MLIFFLFSTLTALASADICPQYFNFPSKVTDFGPWNATSNQQCTFRVYQQNTAEYESLTLTFGNIGPNDRVTISSKNGSVLLANRRYFKETFTVFQFYTINIVTGPNTQLVMEFDGAAGNAYNPPVVATLEFPTPVRSFVLYLDQWLPYTAITFSSPDPNHRLVIQKAEIISDPADFLQWSNVLIYDQSAVGSLFTELDNNGAYVSTYSSVTLQLTQPISFKGAILITTSYNMDKYDSYGVVYANPALPTQTFLVGASTTKKSCFTVIGDRDGTTPITVRTASPTTLSMTYGGPNSDHTVSLPLNQLPVQLGGNLWTFYSNQGSGLVKISAEE